MKIKHAVIIIVSILAIVFLVAMIGVATDGLTSFSNMTLKKVNPDNLIKLDSYKLVEIEDDKATGYTIDITEDGEIKIKGENESETAVKLSVQDVTLQAEDYYFSSSAKVDDKTYYVTIENADGTVIFDEEGVIEVETAGTYTVYIIIEAETEINETFSLVLVEGEEKQNFFVVK